MLFRRLIGPFLFAFIALTAMLLINIGVSRPRPAGQMLEMLALSVPFTAALTIPMALFIATLAVSLGLCSSRKEGTSPSTQGDVPRLLRSVLVISLGVAAFTLLLTAEIVPRANARLSNVLAGHEVARGDRSMTLGELRAAERAASIEPLPFAVDDRDPKIRAANLGIEIHKKFVLAASCIVLALAGTALGWRFPRGGTTLLLVASVLVFGLYFVSLSVGETLAEQLVLSPGIAMWAANVLGLSVAGLAVLSARRDGARMQIS